MNNNIVKVLWFALSFVISLGSYICFHIMGNWNGSYGFIPASLTAFVYILVCSMFYLIYREDKKPLALGFLWGLISILIFLFTLGGCGLAK